MRKIYSLLLLGAFMLLGAQNAWGKADFLGHSAVNINSTWYYCYTELDWCDGGAFDDATIGTISHLSLGGQSQVWETGNINWNGGGEVTMYYKIDNGSPQSIAMTWGWFDNGTHNNYFQPGGATMTPVDIDISGLDEGDHTIAVWFNCDEKWDSKSEHGGTGNWTASFTIEKATITLASACTDGSKYYGTYCNTKAFEVPSGLTVSTIEITAGGVLDVTDYSEGDIVKAGAGVMVSSTTYGDKTVYLTDATGTEPSTNMLKPSGASGISASTMSTGVASGTKFYRLTMHNNLQIGFYWGAEGGAGFALGANKAYLQVASGLQAPSRFWIEDEENNATDIQNIEASEKAVKFIKSGQLFIQKDGVVYDVTGRIAK